MVFAVGGGSCSSNSRQERAVAHLPFRPRRPVNGSVRCTLSYASLTSPSLSRSAATRRSISCSVPRSRRNRANSRAPASHVSSRFPGFHVPINRHSVLSEKTENVGCNNLRKSILSRLVRIDFFYFILFAKKSRAN